MRRSDLPTDRATLSEVLLSIVGSGHALNIDGIGGGAAVTTKVAMLSQSSNDWADVDYFFAQVSVEERLVDYKPTCGNILAGVGPAAIELGLVDAKEGETTIRINAVNTGAKIETTVKTPGKAVTYDGAMRIDGVPGSASPVSLQFMETVGGISGAFLPTGHAVDEIGGIRVTCMDVAMPVVIARAESFGLTGYESAAELDDNRAFFQHMEEVRVEAGMRMGMGDVRTSVTPKFAIVAPPRKGGTIAARYFMPWKTHPTMAVTGAQCLASCVLTPGTVVDVPTPNEHPAHIVLEHAAGTIDVTVDYQMTDAGFTIKSAGLVRTARKIASGEVFVPESVWDGD